MSKGRARYETLALAVVVVMLGRIAGAGAATVAVPLNADGTFGAVLDPLKPDEHTVVIDEGDSVLWTGLGTTDSVVQIAGPPTAGMDLCADPALKRAYNLHGPYSANELTGPPRIAASGIIALSPNDCGLYQIDVTAGESCAAGDSLASTQVGDYQLCERATCAIEDKYRVMERTWASPDITGVFLRIDWKDLNPTPDGILETRFLDREMNQAVRYGKVFTIGIRVGSNSTPPWVFDENQTGFGLAATPVVLRDWSGGTNEPPPPSCGTRYVIPSPSDVNFRNHFTAMLQALAAHVAQDSRWYNALAAVKVTGLGLETLENKMPKRCNVKDPSNNQLIDAADPYVNGVDASGGYNYLYPQPGGGYTTVRASADCVCNPQVLEAAGYAPSELYRFYRYVEAALYDAFPLRPMQYMLIQDGFPQIGEGDRFEGDTLLVAPSPPSVPGVDYPMPVEQTEQILAEAREGRWISPESGNTAWPPNATAFVVQHAGLQELPQDQGKPACPQQQGIDVSGGSLAVNVNYGSPTFPIPHGTGAFGGVGSGCPNKWATKEGVVHHQLTGFQTVAGLTAPEEIDSALWNMTASSNALFFESYEKAFWTVATLRGEGSSAAALDAAPYLLGDPYTANSAFALPKNLFDWGKVLHGRRAKVALAGSPPNPFDHFLQDPFPTSWQAEFLADIGGPGTSVDYYYINPRLCTTPGSSTFYMKVTVQGR